MGLDGLGYDDFYMDQLGKASEGSPRWADLSGLSGWLRYMPMILWMICPMFIGCLCVSIYIYNTIYLCEYSRVYVHLKTYTIVMDQ